ncbi:hypothetical protein L484_023914 [Morus notabilis]|uniref:Uncharacterized protein n=1 Tax=Morus notabilis TaxID=981085 RepID=W9R0K8_9ROSA|nr:hypothetical protein L484_023914 [Morus notabilis]
MEDQNLDELQRACYLSKENSRLYEAYYEEKRKVNDLGKECEKLKKRINELEKNELTTLLLNGREKLSWITLSSITQFTMTCMI